MVQPVDVYAALTDFVTTRLGVTCFVDEEPEQSTASDQYEIPFVTLTTNGQVNCEHNFETRSDAGSLSFHCYGLIGDARRLGVGLDALFADPNTWPTIPIATGQFRAVMITGYGLYKEANRDKNNNPVYRYDLAFEVEVNRNPAG